MKCMKTSLKDSDNMTFCICLLSLFWRNHDTIFYTMKACHNCNLLYRTEVKLTTAAICFSVSKNVFYKPTAGASLTLKTKIFFENYHFKTYRVQKFPGVINDSSATQLRRGEFPFSLSCIICFKILRMLFHE